MGPMNRMIRPDQLDKIKQILGCDAVFIAAIYQDQVIPSMTQKKFFLGFTNVCQHDINDMVEIIKKNPLPADICDNTKQEPPELV